MDEWTKIADLISQQAFTDAVVKESLKLSKFYQCGIISADPLIQKAADDSRTGGWTINMPYYDAIDKNVEEAEPIAEGQALTIHKMTMGQDVAIATRRGVALGWTDLARSLAGGNKDPAEVAKMQIGKLWMIEAQKKLIATLNGVFANNVTANNSDLYLDLTEGKTSDADTSKLNALTFFDAAQMLGDRKTNLSGLAMNSKVGTFLSKLDAARDGSGYQRPSANTWNLATYDQKALIEDDDIDVGTYEVEHKDEHQVVTKKTVCTYADIYLFGYGAVGSASVKVQEPLEPFRETLKSQGGFVTRMGNLMHVRGIKFNGTPGNLTNTQLATGTNWSRVWDRKDIRVVKVRANLSVVETSIA